MKLGQGNIFIGMCQDFCSQGGVWSWGVPPNFQGSSSKFSGVSNFSGGFLQIFEGSSKFWGGVPPNFQGGSPIFFGGSKIFSFLFSISFPPKKILLECTNPPTPPRRSMRGRYVSYWNAFLFHTRDS